MGTLVAGVAHDAINLFLRLHMLLEHIENTELTEDAREDLKAVRLIILQFQNSVVNLRWLSTDSTRSLAATETLDLHEWAVDVAAFHRLMLPDSITLVLDVPRELSRVRISAAALSQAVFNLIRNAQQAITSANRPGQILIAARPISDGRIIVSVQDDGPGMSAQTLRHSTETYFTTRAEGSGLGLALVRELITSSGGSVAFLSPPIGQPHGTLVLLTLPHAP